MRSSDEAQHEESFARRLLSISTEISFLEGHEVLGRDSRVGRAPFCCLIAFFETTKSLKGLTTSSSIDFLAKRNKISSGILSFPLSQQQQE